MPIIWYADHLYTSYSFELYMKEKKGSKKKENRKKGEKNKIFMFSFLNSEKDK